MANKPTLFYTLVARWYIGGFAIMRVTTEKNRRFYGSLIGDEQPTHCRPDQTRGRFETAEAAAAVVDRVVAARIYHEPFIQEAHKQYLAAQNAERLAIEAIVNPRKELTHV